MLAGGGGGGGYSKVDDVAVTPGSVLRVSVGQGGKGGVRTDGYDSWWRRQRRRWCCGDLVGRASRERSEGGEA